jgi:hypothetical protein
MRTASLLAVALLGAARLGAQQAAPRMPMDHTMGDPMDMQEMMGPMMGILVYTPQHLLARRDALALTSDQVTRLSTLRNAAATGREAATREANGHLQAMQQATARASADTTALKTHFDAAHAAMGRAHWLSIAAAVQAKNVLTDAQRKQVAVWADSLHVWMRQHREMMQPGHTH